MSKKFGCLIAPFEQFLKNIYRASATNGNWSVSNAERAVFFLNLTDDLRPTVEFIRFFKS